MALSQLFPEPGLPGIFTPLNILSLPDEILIEIFNAVKENNRYKLAHQLAICHSQDASSRNDIANIRLACRRFAATSSHLLVSSVQLHDISTSSLEKLEAIAHHPEIGKGVRTVRLSTCFYTPGLAGDLRNFAWYAINKVFSAAVTCQEDIQTERRQVEEAGSGISETLFKKWMSGIAALEDVMEVLKSWSQLTATGGSEIMGSPLYPSSGTTAAATARIRDPGEERQHLMLLHIAHALYRSRYQDQEVMLADGRFVERFAQAMARMPKAKVLEVVDFNHDDKNCSTCRYPGKDGEALLGVEVKDVDLYDSLLDIDSFIQPSSWDEAITHRWSSMPPVEILFKLPVSLQQADVTLDRIVYSTGVCTEEFYPLLAKASADDFLNLGAAAQALGIRSFSFLQGDEEKPFARKTPSVDDVKAFKGLITAMSNSERLERLRIRLGGGWSDGSLDPDHQHNLGNLLWPAPLQISETASARIESGPPVPWGQNLRDVSITGVPLTLSDLSSFATHLRDGGAKLDFLSLSRACLISGSWKDALDILREIDVNCEKSLFAPSGAECDDVTMQLTERYDRIFCAEPGSESMAECYINGEVKRNPLRSGWAVDFVYSVDDDAVVVSIVSAEDSGDEDEDEEYDDDDDDEDTEVGEEEQDETILSGKDVEGTVLIVGEPDDVWDEMPSFEHVEYT